MNNEPVAWMLLRDESCVELTEWFGVMRGWEDFLGDNEKIVELYTHPSEHDLGIAEAIGFDKGYKAATAKTLTAEEITELTPWNKHPYESFVEYTIDDLVDFARAILRKAQEK
jgi:hypothetical protein